MKNLTKATIFWTILLFPQLASAQIDLQDSVLIGDIEVMGNEKTRTHVVTRELEFESGQWVTMNELAQARLRIMNLNLFNNVDFLFQEGEDSLDLRIVVYERWYLFPVPIFFINDRDWDKLSYGFGLAHVNFRGKAETLWASAWFGYNPGFNLNYNNPWFGGDRRFYSRVKLVSQEVRSKTFEFSEEDERHRQVAVEFGRRYGLHLYLDFEFKINVIRPTNRNLLWLSSNTEDQNLTSGVGIRYDNRDLWEYPKKGYRLEFLFSRTHLLNGGKAFNLWSADLRRYQTIRGITFAARMNADLTQNPVPSYSRLYLGYDERIRGHFERIVEGENRLLAGLEARIPILKERFIPLPQDTWFSSYLQFLRFGLYLTIFHDMGAVWMQDEPLNADRFIGGSGLGLNFILPYSIVARLEYAFDDQGRGETIFDVGLTL